MPIEVGSTTVSRQGCTTDGRPADATVKARSADAGTLPVGRSGNSATRRWPGSSAKDIGFESAQSSAPHETVNVRFAW